jgi:hypothetical protein
MKTKIDQNLGILPVRRWDDWQNGGKDNTRENTNNKRLYESLAEILYFFLIKCYSILWASVYRATRRYRMNGRRDSRFTMSLSV